MMREESLESTQEAKSCSQWHLKQLLDFFRAFQTSCIHFNSMKHAEALMHWSVVPQHFNPFTPKSDLNRFYLSKGDPLGVKGLIRNFYNHFQVTCLCISSFFFSTMTLFSIKFGIADVGFQSKVFVNWCKDSNLFIQPPFGMTIYKQ